MRQGGLRIVLGLNFFVDKVPHIGGLGGLQLREIGLILPMTCVLLRSIQLCGIIQVCSHCKRANHFGTDWPAYLTYLATLLKTIRFSTCFLCKKLHENQV